MSDVIFITRDLGSVRGVGAGGIVSSAVSFHFLTFPVCQLISNSFPFCPFTVLLTLQIVHFEADTQAIKRLNKAHRFAIHSRSGIYVHQIHNATSRLV
jgi:hypothetical protein